MYNPFLVQLERYRDLFDFLETDDREPQGGSDPPADWPTQGVIKMEDVTFRYAPDMPAALRGVSLEIGAREKLGIVGRTGAGKSTLANLLLRLGPLKGVAPWSGGRVLLDGVDIADLKLSALRRAIGIVPQDP